MLMKINKKITVEILFKNYKKTAQANLEYFLAQFQALQPPSTQSKIPLSPKPYFFLLVLVGWD
jgi:hypothetical protein